MTEKKYRKSVFIVTYAKTKKGVQYLLLKRHKHWTGWEFPKGGRRMYETNRMALRRELKEETGLRLLDAHDLEKKGHYDYPPSYEKTSSHKGQEYVLFAAEVKKDAVKIDKKEHSTYKWCGYEQAHKLLTYANQKQCLALVHERLASTR